MASAPSTSVDEARKILQECKESASKDLEIRRSMAAECEAMVAHLREAVVKPAEEAKKQAEDRVHHAQTSLMDSSVRPCLAQKLKSPAAVKADAYTTKVDRILETLPEGASVATVYMLGSLCPITLGHVQCYLEARRILLNQGALEAPRPARLERFDECIGLVQLNSDSHVISKLEEKGQKSINIGDRGHLVTLATTEYPWLCYDESCRLELDLSKRWPNLRFTQFDMNGADDVVKYEKWMYVGPGYTRRITVGRPGSTAAVRDGMRKSGIDPDDGYFFLTQDLPDISSTAAREASAAGDSETLLTILHPAVADWLLRRDGHAGLVTPKSVSMPAQRRNAPAADSSALKPSGTAVKLPVVASSRGRARSTGRVEMNSSDASSLSRARSRSTSRVDAAGSTHAAASSKARARSTGRLDGAHNNQIAALSRLSSGGSNSSQASPLSKIKSGGRGDAATPKKAAAKATSFRRSTASTRSSLSASNTSTLTEVASAIDTKSTALTAAKDAESEHCELVRSAWSLVLGKSAEAPPLSMLQLREQLRVHLVEEGAEGLPRDEALGAMDELLQWELGKKILVDSWVLARTELDSRLALWQGDITTLRIGAIVNAANEKGLGCFQPDHRCIDNIIHCAAGPALRVACYNELQQERWKGQLPTGEAMVTAGFNLPSDYVIHVPGPRCHFGIEQPEMLASCYRNVLEACRMHSIRSVAFCCISTGLFGYPAEGAAKVAVSTVRQWLDETSEGDFMDLVVFNVFLKSDLQIYNKILA